MGDFVTASRQVVAISVNYVNHDKPCSSSDDRNSTTVDSFTAGLLLLFLSLAQLSNNGMTTACEKERRLETSAAGSPGRSGLEVQGKEQFLYFCLVLLLDHLRWNMLILYMI